MRTTIKWAAPLCLLYTVSIIGCSQYVSDQPVSDESSKVELGTLHQALVMTMEDVSAHHRLLLLESAGGAFSIVAQHLLEAPLPSTRRVVERRGWSVRAKDQSGLIVMTTMIENPHVIRGTFAAPGGGTTGVSMLSGEPARFGLRVPAQAVLVEVYDGAIGTSYGTSNLIGSVAIN